MSTFVPRHILVQLRLAAGLTQRELADRIGLEPYTIVSQIESGIGRIDPEHVEPWANALGINALHLLHLAGSAAGGSPSTH